jgi:formylglycine-generating enzyme required for sulfatase activity
MADSKKDPQKPSIRRQNANGPRKSSDVLSERLVQLRERVELAEHERDEANTLNRSLAEEVQALRQKMPQVSQGGGATRNVGLEAELEALRQETAMLRQAVKNKDKALEDLASQCRGLEDVLEDRDWELDRLQRELDHSRGDSDISEDNTPSGLAICGGELGLAPPYTLREKDSIEGPGKSNAVRSTARHRPVKALVTAGVGALLVAALVLIGFFALSSSDGVDFGAQELQPAAQLESETSPQTPVAGAAIRRIVDTGSVQFVPPVVREPARRRHQEPKTEHDRLGDGSTGPQLVGLPGGEFVMGSTRGLVAKNEQPAHRRRLEPFFIGRYEVTFAQYERFARATGRPLPDDAGWGRGDRPAINVSWVDAKAYTNWLSRQTHKNYRLPTEAEWEYAARGGSSDRFWWGYSPERGRAVCFDCGSRWDNRSTAPVGSLVANPFGLYDTAGNVMEWVEDCYNKDYTRAPEDGRAWLAGDCAQRIARGGAYNKPIASLRSAARFQLPHDAGFDMVGFRVARDE